MASRTYIASSTILKPWFLVYTAIKGLLLIYVPTHARIYFISKVFFVDILRHMCRNCRGQSIQVQRLMLILLGFLFSLNISTFRDWKLNFGDSKGDFQLIFTRYVFWWFINDIIQLLGFQLKKLEILG